MTKVLDLVSDISTVDYHDLASILAYSWSCYVHTMKHDGSYYGKSANFQVAARPNDSNWAKFDNF